MQVEMAVDRPIREEPNTTPAQLATPHPEVHLRSMPLGRWLIPPIPSEMRYRSSISVWSRVLEPRRPAGQWRSS